MVIPTRIYVSCPGNRHLDQGCQELKRGLLEKMRRRGFDPQEYHVSGLPAETSWTFASACAVMARCQGAAILGLPRWRFDSPAGPVLRASDYNHFEGALAVSSGIPTLILQAGVEDRGIFYVGGGQSIISVSEAGGAACLLEPEFEAKFQSWADKVARRYHVFVGYSSGAEATANALIAYLGSLGVRFLDWKNMFRAGRSILDNIREASDTCLGGIFLFTRDDLLEGQDGRAAPRDNVVFEAGYFASAKGIDRTLIVLEEGAKMPADLGGIIYLPLKNRADISPIKAELRNWVESAL